MKTYEKLILQLEELSSHISLNNLKNIIAEMINKVTNAGQNELMTSSEMALEYLADNVNNKIKQKVRIVVSLFEMREKDDESLSELLKHLTELQNRISYRENQIDVDAVARSESPTMINDESSDKDNDESNEWCYFEDKYGITNNTLYHRKDAIARYRELDKNKSNNYLYFHIYYDNECFSSIHRKYFDEQYPTQAKLIRFQYEVLRRNQYEAFEKINIIAERKKYSFVRYIKEVYDMLDLNQKKTFAGPQWFAEYAIQFESKKSNHAASSNNTKHTMPNACQSTGDTTMKSRQDTHIVNDNSSSHNTIDEKIIQCVLNLGYHVPDSNRTAFFQEKNNNGIFTHKAVITPTEGLSDDDKEREGLRVLERLVSETGPYNLYSGNVVIKTRKAMTKGEKWDVSYAKSGAEIGHCMPPDAPLGTVVVRGGTFSNLVQKVKNIVSRDVVALPAATVESQVNLQPVLPPNASLALENAPAPIEKSVANASSTSITLQQLATAAVAEKRNSPAISENGEAASVISKRMIIELEKDNANRSEELALLDQKNKELAEHIAKLEAEVKAAEQAKAEKAEKRKREFIEKSQKAAALQQKIQQELKMKQALEQRVNLLTTLKGYAEQSDSDSEELSETLEQLKRPRC